MKICEIDREVKGVIAEHSVYGCEAIINAIARAAKHDRWLTGSALHALLDAAISREIEEGDDNENIWSGLS